MTDGKTEILIKMKNLYISWRIKRMNIEVEYRINFE